MDPLTLGRGCLGCDDPVLPGQPIRVSEYGAAVIHERCYQRRMFELDHDACEPLNTPLFRAASRRIYDHYRKRFSRRVVAA